MKISNELYDFLKALTINVLPALGALYFALSQIWGLPYGEQITGTLAAVATFTGVLIKAAQIGYEKEESEEEEK